MRCVAAGCRALLCVLMLSAAGCGTALDIDSGTKHPSFPGLTHHDGATLTPAKTANAARPDKSGATSKTISVKGTGVFVGRPPSTRPQDKDAEPGKGVTLNLVKVPTAQAAKTVLGDAVRYTVDPAVRGEITIQTPNPVSRAAVLDLFHAALRANGAALVSARGQVRIVPADQAVSGAPIYVEGTPGAKDRVGSGLHIVQLKYVAASEMQRILEPMAPRGGIVRADQARNTITLAGSRQEVGDVAQGASHTGAWLAVRGRRAEGGASRDRRGDGIAAGVCQVKPRRLAGSAIEHDLGNWEREYIARLSAHAAETRTLWSNEWKPERERMVVRAFLRCMGIGFAESEIQSETDDPPDVVFREARFEVMEVLGGRKRGDEWRDREQRYAKAESLSDVTEPYTPSEPMPMTEASHMCVDGLQDKAVKYGAALCSQLDAPGVSQSERAASQCDGALCRSDRDGESRGRRLAFGFAVVCAVWGDQNRQAPRTSVPEGGRRDRTVAVAVSG